MSETLLAARLLLEKCKTLRAENELLKLRVAELEARLAMKDAR